MPATVVAAPAETAPTHVASFELATKYIKSYKTKEALVKALVKLGIAHHRHMVVYTEEGKVTAVFTQNNFKTHEISYLGYYAEKGFTVFG